MTACVAASTIVRWIGSVLLVPSSKVCVVMLLCKAACPQISAARMAGPTAVVDMALPAKSWISAVVSVVKEILLNGRPCKDKSSCGARALPGSDEKNNQEGVMQGVIPNWVMSLKISMFWET